MAAGEPKVTIIRAAPMATGLAAGVKSTPASNMLKISVSRANMPSSIAGSSPTTAIVIPYEFLALRSSYEKYLPNRLKLNILFISVGIFDIVYLLKSDFITSLLRCAALNRASILTLLSRPSLLGYTCMKPPGSCSE